MLIMTTSCYLDLTQHDGVTVGHFKSPHFLLVEEYQVLEIGRDLLALADEQEGTRLILDFSEVQDLSSLMLGQLMKLRVRVAANRGRLVLCGLSPDVQEFFDETMLGRLFTIEETVADACCGLHAPACDA